jgi:iron complex outermembrane receptor protein
MKFGQKKVAVALALGGTALMAGVPADAADVVRYVTGSNIPRIEIEGALPVQTITRQDIEREGIQTAMGVVERLSANSSIGGINLQGQQGSTLVGYAAASLRGLGAARTLVLMNGRRLANTAFSGTTVDINSIPLSAIERVEVLTDGASAIYGTDAIAGVINFIMRQDFTGIDATAYYGDSDNGGGSVQRYNVTGGWGDLTKDKFNIFATVDYNKIEAIAAAQRNFSKSAYLPNAAGGVYDRTSGNSIPGNVFLPGTGGQPGQTLNPKNPACLPPYSFPTNGSPTQCRFDYASVIDILPPSESWNTYGAARWQFATDHQAYIEASWSQTQATSRVSPSPISSATILSGDPVLTIPSSPFYPTAFAIQNGVNGQNLEVFWRGLDLGPRTDFNTTEQTRIVGGLQGMIAGWDYNAYVNWSQSKATDEWQAGWVLGSAILPILNGGQINLFGLNTPAQIALMRPAQVLGTVLDNTGTMTEVNLVASREIYKLPAGPLTLALGGMWRNEQFEQTSSSALASGDVPGFGGSVASLPEVTRNMWAFYGELSIPIVKDLEADVALRYDDYEGVGTTWNPKVALRWQPMKELLLRGAYGTGFRAPGLPELFIPTYVSATGGTYSDPLRCPSTGSPRDCKAQFNTQLGGNANLKPETSTNWTGGVVWQPAPSLSLGAQYWWVQVKDIIGVKGEASIFGDMVGAQAAGLLFRYAPGSSGCSASDQAGGLPCPVFYGVQTNLNVNQITTSGWDFNVNYRFPQTSFGQLNFDFAGTYVAQWDQQETGGQTMKLVGTYAGGIASNVIGPGSTGAFPRWKHNANLAWNMGPWSANLNQTFVQGYTEPADDTPTRQVGTYSVFGLNGSYTGFKNFTLTLGIKNVFNTDPPYTRQNQAFQIGYDPYIADPTGRFFWGSIRYAFK